MEENPATWQSSASGQCSLPHNYNQLLPCQRYKARMCIFAPYHVNTVLFAIKWIWLLLAKESKNTQPLQGRFELAMNPCPPQARLSWSMARADSLVTTTWTSFVNCVSWVAWAGWVSQITLIALSCMITVKDSRYMSCIGGVLANKSYCCDIVGWVKKVTADYNGAW